MQRFGVLVVFVEIYFCFVFGRFTGVHEELTWTRPLAPQNATVTEQVMNSTRQPSHNSLAMNNSHYAVQERRYQLLTTTLTRNTTKEKQERGKKHLEGITTNDILLVCGFAFTLIVGLLGNSFVCYFFGFKSKRNRSVTETLILYLGIVDLLASIVNPLLFSYWTLSKYRRWDFGVIGCKILAPLAPVTVTISASIIMIICIDRYRAIVSPFRGQLAKKQVNFAVVIATILSIASHANYIYYLEVDEGAPCFVVYGGELGYAVPYIVGTMLRDLMYIILFCFTTFLISRQLEQRKDANVNVDYSLKRRKESRKITRVLYRIGLIFGLLVFPKDFLSIASTISWLSPPGIRSTRMLLYINAWLKVLNVSNSCVNVFIYAHVHMRFKREICKLFPICIRIQERRFLGRHTVMTECDEMHEMVTNCKRPQGQIALIH